MNFTILEFAEIKSLVVDKINCLNSLYDDAKDSRLLDILKERIDSLEILYQKINDYESENL